MKMRLAGLFCLVVALSVCVLAFAAPKMFPWLPWWTPLCVCLFALWHDRSTLLFFVASVAGFVAVYVAQSRRTDGEPVLLLAKLFQFASLGIETNGPVAAGLVVGIVALLHAITATLLYYSLSILSELLHDREV